MTKLFCLQKTKVTSGIHLNTWKYNVWKIKLEMKLMRGPEDFIVFCKYECCP